MALINCSCKSNCTVLGFVAALIVGVVTAFLQITGVITLAAPFLWVAFAVAVGALGVLLAVAAFLRESGAASCLCTALNALLVGILGTVLFALVLLAVGITATSVISALLVGALAFFFTVIFTSAACLTRCLADCGE